MGRGSVRLPVGETWWQALFKGNERARETDSRRGWKARMKPQPDRGSLKGYGADSICGCVLQG